MERNVKIYPIYKMFAYNILFIHAIQLLFYIEVKGLDLYQIGITFSIFFLFSMIFQIPASIISDKIGLKNTMLLGNVGLILYIILLILVKGFIGLILIEACCALGYALSGCSESPFLYSSLKKINRASEFSHIESIGYTYHFVMMAITYIASGYLYRINPYLPLILATLFLVIANLICYSLESVNVISQKTPVKEFVEDFKFGFKFIFHSRRLRALMLFSFLLVGIISISELLMKAYLNNINSLPIVFGYFFAAFAIVSAIGAMLQKKIENKLRNKTLSSIGMYYISLFIVVGIVLFIFKSYTLLLIFGVILFLFMALLKGTYLVVIQEYLSRYTTSIIRSKIQSIYHLTKSLGSFILMLITSYCLKTMSLPLSFIILGSSLFIVMILVSIYMDSRAGLDPEKYTTKDRMDIMEKIVHIEKND